MLSRGTEGTGESEASLHREQCSSVERWKARNRASNSRAVRTQRGGLGRGHTMDTERVGVQILSRDHQFNASI